MTSTIEGAPMQGPDKYTGIPLGILDGYRAQVNAGRELGGVENPELQKLKLGLMARDILTAIDPASFSRYPYLYGPTEIGPTIDIGRLGSVTLHKGAPLESAASAINNLIIVVNNVGNNNELGHAMKPERHSTKKILAVEVDLSQENFGEISQPAVYRNRRSDGLRELKLIWERHGHDRWDRYEFGRGHEPIDGTDINNAARILLETVKSAVSS